MNMTLKIEELLQLDTDSVCICYFGYSEMFRVEFQVFSCPIYTKTEGILSHLRKENTLQYYL